MLSRHHAPGNTEEITYFPSGLVKEGIDRRSEKRKRFHVGEDTVSVALYRPIKNNKEHNILI